jgi:ligand-binding sensor domain-containing protein/signal transduction histidine kinase
LLSKTFSFFHSAQLRAALPVVGVLTFASIFCSASLSEGLAPEKRVSQYLTDHWTARDGLPKGRINSIGQTQDGYLWIATSKGLVRFDGFRFRAVDELQRAAHLASPSYALLVDGKGSLWLQAQGLRLFVYRNQAFQPVSLPGFPPGRFYAMCRGRGEGLVLSILGPGFVRYQPGMEGRLPSPGKLTNSPPRTIAETSDGRVWVGTHTEGLFSFDGAGVHAVAEGVPDTKINTLLAVKNAGLWIGTDTGLAFWDGHTVSNRFLPAPLQTAQILSLLEDRDGNLWIGTSDGLFRLSSKDRSLESVRDESGKAITCLFEDREGNLWVGDSYGVERIREGAFATFSIAEGLPAVSSGPIYAMSHGQVCVAPSQGGLYRITNGSVESLAISGIGNDIIYSIAGQGDDLWLGRRQTGLTHVLVPTEDKYAVMAAKTYTQKQGLAQNSISTVFRSRDGTIWAGTLSGGVSKFRDGKFVSFTTSNGLESNSISSIAEGADGTMWFATSDGLTSLLNGHWKTFTERDGLPSNEVISLYSDSSGVLWIGTANGLAFLQTLPIRVTTESQPLLHEAILGLAEDRLGSLWVASSNHIFEVRRSALLTGVLKEGDFRKYGPLDGLGGTDGIRRDRSVVSDDKGRIWFSASRGVSVIDPLRGDGNQAPALPQVEEVSVDGVPRDLNRSTRIPPLPQKLTITFVGLSLAVPERVRYRYKLDGVDQNWSEPTESRQAVYMRLRPGSYHFHLVAANGNGKWSTSEAAVPFTIEPAYWQTAWFQFTCALLFFLCIWALYRLRMLQITRQLNLRFEERLTERTRIAQELHDTLLQGVISASMLIHVAADQVAPDSTAKSTLQRILNLMSQVTRDGRSTLKGLRSQAPEERSLEEAFGAIPEETAWTKAIDYVVTVQGTPRALNPASRDEMYRIGREAVVNAFRHSGAKNIVVQVDYAAKHLLLMISDDGCGIDAQTLESGREGHWGLHGIRERAQKLGGKVNFRTQQGVGTDVELIIPSRCAYQNKLRRSLLSWRKGASAPRARKSMEMDGQD